MIVSFSLDGKAVFEGEVDVAPPIGASVVFRMKVTRGDLKEGSLVTGKISGDHPPVYDFDTLAPHVWISLSVCDVREALD